MAYNLLDIRSRVRTKIKDSSYSAATIDGFINDAIEEIAGLFPFKYFAKIDTTGTLTIGNNTYTNPSDHMITTRFILVHPTTPTIHWDITRYWKNNDEFFNEWPAPDTLSNSQPTYWTEYGNKNYFNCPADLAYKVRQHYQRLPTELIADSDVPDLPRSFREAIVIGASYRCEAERQNYDISAVLENSFGDKISDLIMLFSNDTLAGPDTVIMPGGRTDSDW